LTLSLPTALLAAEQHQEEADRDGSESSERRAAVGVGAVPCSEPRAPSHVRHEVLIPCRHTRRHILVHLRPHLQARRRVFVKRARRRLGGVTTRIQCDTPRVTSPGAMHARLPMPR
jgi:hypothetical protein